MFDSQIKTGRKGRGNLLEVGESPFYFSFLFFFFFLKKKERDGGRGGVVVCVLFSFILYHTYLTAVSAGAAPYSSLLQTAAGRRLGVRSGSETAAGSAAVSSAAGGLL